MGKRIILEIHNRGCSVMKHPSIPGVGAPGMWKAKETLDGMGE